jgi:signal peptidase I
MDATPEPPKPTWEEIEAEYHHEVGNVRRDDPEARSRTRRRVRSLVEWAIAIGGALLVAWFIQVHLLQAFVIPSASMEPTLVDRDRVLVNKLANDIGRGDVIVFRRPPDVEMGEVEDLIKRVIAVGGDTVEARDGLVRLNGVPITERYLAPDSITEDFGPEVVPPDHLFVMGDNRGPAMSFDSRFFGPISEELVIGRAFLVVWPLSRFERL